MSMIRTASVLSLMNTNMSIARLNKGTSVENLSTTTVIIVFIIVIVLFIYLIKNTK